MAAETYNSIGGFSVNWPAVDVIDSSGNVVTNHNFPSGNVTTNDIFANNYYYGNGAAFSSNPAGLNTQIQYNDNGRFGANDDLTFDASTGTTTATNIVASTSANLGDAGNVTITGGVNGYVLQTDGSGVLSWTAQTGGGGGNGVPGGANTQVQFNNAGVFSGDAGFVYDLDTDLLTAVHIAGEGGNISNVQVANITGLGNIATINLTGSTTNILYGNGVFAALPAIDSNFANYAGNVVTSAQPNITSLGTLISLSVAGQLTAADISSAGSLGTDTFLVSETSLFNGNVTFASGANISSAANVQFYNSPNVNLAIANLHIDGGLNGQVLSTDGAGTLRWTAGGGGGNGTPGGSNTQIQFNNAGTFGGSPYMTFDNVTNKIVFASELEANIITIGSGSFTFRTSEIYFATTETTSPTELYMVDAADVSSVDYTIIATDATAGKRQTTKISAIYYDSEVNYNKTSSLFVGGVVGDFSVDYTSGTAFRDPKVVLSVSPATANSTTYKIMIERYAP
tara:strand:- start:1001 stop:2533 length:1533 start_codon:yes stop_codon:yes gene_type:complete